MSIFLKLIQPSAHVWMMIMMMVMLFQISRPVTNYRSTSGDNCDADFVVILGGSNGGSSDPATCVTPTAPAASSVDR